MTKQELTLKPKEQLNGSTLLPPAELRVYSSSVEGAVTLVMADGPIVQAGLRLDRFQVAELINHLADLIGTADDEPFTTGYELGFSVSATEFDEQGYRRGYEDGFTAGHVDGYEEGFSAAKEEDAA